MLNYFVRNLTYFQTVRNNRELNTGYIYDNEFLKLQNYINNKILPTIDSLKRKKIHGILDSDGYLLRNIGNKLTKFDRVRDSDIPNNIIDFDRLSKITRNSIIYCDVDDLTFVPYTAVNTTFVNNINNCSFEKIRTNNIRNSSITSAKVALKTLTINHLAAGALNNLINAMIPAVKILDDAIDENKLADRSVTEAKLKEDTVNLRDNLHLTFVRQGVTGLANDTHIIKTNHIANNSVDFKHLFQNNRILQNTCIAPNSIQAFNNSTIKPYVIFYGNPITNDHIKDRSFLPRTIENKTKGINKYKLSAIIKQKLIAGGLVV
jgi:hypothetical protein